MLYMTFILVIFTCYLYKILVLSLHKSFFFKHVPSTSELLKPSKHGGGDAERPSLPCFLLFNQNILRQPIPENS